METIAKLTDLAGLTDWQIGMIEKVVLLGLENELTVFQACFVVPALKVTADEIRNMTEQEKDELRARCRSRQV